MKKLLFLILFSFLFSATLEYNYLPKIYEKKVTKSPKAFIVSGIHGDEFGAYLANLYLYHTLKLKNGNIKFLPFLNNKGVIKTFRYIKGVGDINDKFAFSKQNILKLPNDIHKKILYVKKSILDFKPDVVLSLHAGWGYSYINNKRWGNSITIDEKKYKNNNLYENALKVLNKINKENRFKFQPYTIKVLKTFSNNRLIDMNDFSAWVLKNNLHIYTIESSKNLRISTQIYNTSFAVVEFLKLYKFKIKNVSEILEIKKIKNFLYNLKKPVINFKIIIDRKRKNISCKYKENKILKVNKTSKIILPNIEINSYGYLLVPFSEKNFKQKYNFKKSINFKIKYFNIKNKKYDNYCYIRFVVK